jgi:prepilin-type N-terminal cleavage/methylation domain-containing protein
MRRGFSLIEVAVASAMAGVIGVAAIAAFAGLNRQLVRLQSESVASDNAKSLVDLAVTDLQGIGGGPIRPWMALWVENGADSASTRPAASGAAAARTARFFPPPVATGVLPDRVTFASLIAEAPSCEVISINATTVGSTGSGASCCLRNLVTAGNIKGRPGRAHAYAIDGADHRQISLSSVDAVACTATWQAGPLAPIDDNPGNLTALVGGTIVAADIKTIFLSRNHDLLVFDEKDGFAGGDIDIQPLEVSRVASDVYDFQVQVGYDTDQDGRIVDTGTTTDEWLFNATGDAPATFDPEAIRMVAIGVIVGVPLTDPDYSSSAQVVGGNLVTGSRLHLRGAMGKAALRNLFIFF